MKLFCVLVAIFAVAAAAPSETDNLLTSALRFVRECGDKSMVLCMKVPILELFNFRSVKCPIIIGLSFTSILCLPTNRADYYVPLMA